MIVFKPKSILTFTVLTCLSFMPLWSQRASLSYLSEYENQAELEASLAANVSPEKAIMSSSSSIDWSKNIFKSNVELDVVKAGISMPSGKASSLNRIQMELPVLVKDPLLSIYVDDTKKLGDLVLEGSLTLEELTRIIDTSHQTPAFFASGTSRLLTQHSINLLDIGAVLVHHKTPYSLQRPIETVASKEYTGIIIDARGALPVQGEFTESSTYPCLFPKIWNEKMELLYERNMVDSKKAKEQGIVHYSSSINMEDYRNVIGKTPLWITAKKVYGINRCDPVISYEDYLKITSIKSNLNILKDANIVILLDEENLTHAVSAPERNKSYYIAYHSMKRYVDENPIPDTTIFDDPTGIKMVVNNLNFIADSAELLPAEKPRISQIADSIKRLVGAGEYTILVEGHTADVNKPHGQLTLSIQRAQAIIDALISEGVPKELFTYKGYGGTMPIADNSTAEGRAQNRRVEITAMPKQTYIQRK